MIFKKKYKIRYYHSFDNEPFNDVYFALGKPGDIARKPYELIRIWTKKEKFEELLKKRYITKEDIISICTFNSQAEKLSIQLK